MKANELTSRDLMVGDWVNLNFDVDYKTGSSIYGHVQVASINKDGTIDVDCTFDNSKSMQDGWYLKLIEPIPLTPEILEKNGFEHKKEKVIIPSKSQEEIEVEYMYCRELRCSFDIIHDYLIFNSNIDLCSIRIIVTYVHELQHLLKLCKIDKEIKL